MGSSNWAELPEHLLDSVLERLPRLSDYVRFSVVCMKWNSVAKDNPRARPLLLVHSGKEETWNLCDVTNDKFLDLQLELDFPNKHKRFCGFSKGWLMVDENFIISLINPFSCVKGIRSPGKSIIKLPKLLPIMGGCCAWKVIISADPISHAKDCIVVAIFSRLNQLAFIRLDKDKTWTFIDLFKGKLIRGSRPNCEILNIHDIVYFRDKVHALDVESRLFCFDATKYKTKDDIMWIYKGSQREEGTTYKKYLVVTSDRKELRMVDRLLRRSLRDELAGNRVCTVRETTKFVVYKFDEDASKWSVVNTLGDDAIFIGDNTSISVSASDVSGCKRSCIYFLSDIDLSGRDHTEPHDSGVYNVETQSFLAETDIGTTNAALKTMSSTRTPIWTMANISV